MFVTDLVDLRGALDMVFQIGSDGILVLVPTLTMLEKTRRSAMLHPSGDSESADEIGTGEEEVVILVCSLCVVLESIQNSIVTMQGDEALRHVDEFAVCLRARVVVVSVVVRDVDPRLHV